MFIGRENELKSLHEMIESPRFELAVVYGQRRIGKTSLILKASENVPFIYFLSRDDVLSSNVSCFGKEAAKFMGLPFTPTFTSIDEAFDSLIRFIGNKKTIILIDELPFLAKSYPGIISFLQGLCDSLKREEKPVKIILSGSDISFMSDLLSNKGKPLYQRCTLKMHVLPMLFSDAAKMLEGFKSEEKAKALALFGNRPYYLEKLDSSRSLESNIISLCFNDKSILTDAPNMTLPLGYPTNSVFKSILVAISRGKNKVKDISSFIGIESNAVSTYLSRMLEGESINKKETFNGNHKTTYYDITDPFIKLYYRVIYPCLHEIEMGLGDEAYKAAKDVIDELSNHGFEDVAISYLSEQNAKKKLNHVYGEFKRYCVDNSELGRSIEIDGLAVSLDKCHLAVMEAKNENKDMSMEVLNHLKESASIFAKSYDDITYYLFSKSSFANDLKNTNDPSIIKIALNDMFK